MRKPPFLCLAMVVASCWGQIAHAGEVVSILQWELGTNVYINGDLDRDLSLTPMNPFHVSQSASLGQSTATTDYGAMWNQDELEFVLEAAHQLADTPTGQLAFSRSSGTLWFETNVPVKINFNLEYAYNIPGSRFESYSVFSIGDQTNNLPLFLEYADGGPLELESPTGVFDIHGMVDVPANTIIVLNYLMRIRTVGGNSSTIGHSGGHLNIAVTAIPEPSACTLLCLGAAFALMRRRAS